MKTIVAGSRSITDQETVDYVLTKLVLKGYIGITEVVSGKAKGVDTLAEVWANKQGIPVQPFPADWDDITHPDSVIRTNKYGKKYNVLAGHWRNQRMAEYADALVAIWDGISNGTKDMIGRAEREGLFIYVYNKKTQRLQRKGSAKITV